MNDPQKSDVTIKYTSMKYLHNIIIFQIKFSRKVKM